MGLGDHRLGTAAVSSKGYHLETEARCNVDHWKTVRQVVAYRGT